MREKKIEVLHVVEATLGGLRRHVVDLLLGLAANYGDEVQLHLAYSLRRADSGFYIALKELQLQGIMCFECAMWRSIHPWPDLIHTIEIAKYIRAKRLRIVHTHSGKGGYIGRLAAKPFRRVKAIYTPNASPFRLSRLYHALEVIAGRTLTTKLIAVSESEKLELVRSRIVASSRVKVIPSGIPDHHRDPEFGTMTWPFRSIDPVVVTAGRISAQKAPLRFIAIAAETVRSWPNAKFFWVGDGELRGDLEHAIREANLEKQVVITGWVDDTTPWLIRSDVFLLASDYESFGYVTAEAMCAGLPCVVSDVPGSRDLVVDGETGYLIPHDAIEAYATAIGQLLETPELLHKMGQEGRKRWKSHFHVSQMVERTFELYKELAK